MPLIQRWLTQNYSPPPPPHGGVAGGLYQLLQRVQGLRLVLAHRAQLLSKDALVLRLARRLLPLGVVVVGPLGSAKAPSLPVSAD